MNGLFGSGTERELLVQSRQILLHMDSVCLLTRRQHFSDWSDAVYMQHWVASEHYGCHLESM